MSFFRDFRLGGLGFLTNGVLDVGGGGVTAGSGDCDPSDFLGGEGGSIPKRAEG